MIPPTLPDFLLTSSTSKHYTWYMPAQNRETVRIYGGCRRYVSNAATTSCGTAAGSALERVESERRQEAELVKAS
jgi:hypothetical protein